MTAPLRVFVSSVQKELDDERLIVQNLRVTYDTANRDLKGLAELQILVREGHGRAARYVLREPGAGA